MKEINFNDYGQNLTSLIGEDFGKAVREQIGEANLSKQELCLIFPENIVVVSFSFWKGFWGKEIYSLSKPQFDDQIKLVCSPHIAARISEFWDKLYI